MPYATGRHQYTDRERSLLAQLVDRHIDVIEEKRNDAESSLRKARAWHNVGLVFNFQPNVSHRTPVQLKKCWENLKTRYKLHLQSDPSEDMTVHHPQFARSLIEWIKEGRKTQNSSSEVIIEPEDNEKSRDIAKKMYLEQPPPKTKRTSIRIKDSSSEEDDIDQDVEEDEDDDDMDYDDNESNSSNYGNETYNSKVTSSGEIVRIKARHFTDKEKLKLVFLVAKNADAIECKKCDSTSLRNKALTWQKITREFNKTERTNWDVRQLKKLWENTKARARKAMEQGVQRPGSIIGNSEVEAIKVLDSLSSTYAAGSSSSQITSEDSAFIAFLKEEINNIKSSIGNNEKYGNVEEENLQGDGALIPIVTFKEEPGSPRGLHHNDAYLSKRRRTEIPEDAASLQKLLYRCQLEMAEEEAALKMKKIKREEFLLEQQHQLQMTILEKQHELAQAQVEYWSQRHLHHH